MRSSTLMLVAVAGAALLARPLAGQDQNEFHWKGKLAQGKTIWIKSINGRVSATLSSGDVEVSAVKRARHSDPDEVKIEVVEQPDGVTICAVYPSYRHHENTCEFGEHSHSDVHDNDVEVDFTVSVPAGVRFSGSTVNGSVDAANLASDVEAHSVNGGIRVSTSGYAEASTVNGSIVASIGRSNWTNTLDFHTVNGGITLDLPAGLSTEVRASTVNGDIITDFPITVTGRFGPRHMNGTIGSGGRELALDTVNGSITLRKIS